MRMRARRVEIGTFDESLLDLFTLISFILILVAFVHATNATRQAPDNSTVTSEISNQGTGTPQSLPRDVLMFVIHRQNNSDRLTIVDGALGSSTNIAVSISTVDQILNERVQRITSSGKIYVSMYEDAEQPNPGVLAELQKRLPDYGCKDYKLYFAGGKK